MQCPNEAELEAGQAMGSVWGRMARERAEDGLCACSFKFPDQGLKPQGTLNWAKAA